MSRLRPGVLAILSLLCAAEPAAAFGAGGGPGALLPGVLLSQAEAEDPAEEVHHGAESGEPAHEEAEEEGVQLTPTADLALWSLVTFLVLLFVLRAFAWKPLISGLDRREASIRNDIAEAEAARAKAAKLLAEHEQRLKSVEGEVREMRSEARATAERMKQEAVSAGQKEAAALVERARVEIEQDRRQAEAELREQLADMVVQAAEQVIRRKLGDGDERRLAEEALSDFTASVR